ncbi:MAG: hypothetical protein LUM44_12390 [Pyrinomonadaceae bacterium]|nr:hypothetical protein [Pyrinomonadaceae bacterium]
MDIIKTILAIIGVIAVVIIGFWLFGIISAILWLLLWVAVIAGIGYGGYKLFFEKEKPSRQLEDKTPIAIADLQDTDRALEEYRRKLLNEKK